MRTKTQEVLAQRAILALGPWLSRALPEIAPVIEVTRQAVGWFRPARPETVLHGRFPLFILERGPDDIVYGFPDVEQRGVKAAPHNHGPKVDADDWAPSATDAELLPVGDALAELVPGAAGPIVDRDICLYTNTLPGDRRPDKGEEFIIDRWPNSCLIVASPCSGHGAKFAPAIGQKLARLALDQAYEASRFFSYHDIRLSPDRTAVASGQTGTRGPALRRGARHSCDSPAQSATAEKASGYL